MWGYFPNLDQWQGGQDTDDLFRCHSCSAQVVMASPASWRSLESKAQGSTRLCSICLDKRKTVGVGLFHNEPEI